MPACGRARPAGIGRAAFSPDAAGRGPRRYPKGRLHLLFFRELSYFGVSPPLFSPAAPRSLGRWVLWARSEAAGLDRRQFNGWQVPFGAAPPPLPAHPWRWGGYAGWHNGCSAPQGCRWWLLAAPEDTLQPWCSSRGVL